MKIKVLTYLLLPLAVLMIISSSMVDPNNPPAGRTGAPGETTCQASGCHSSGTFVGTVEITGVPDTVVANQTYSITLTNSSDAVKSGFQLTVLDEANAKVGTLTAGTGCSIGNAGGRQYVRQSSPRTLMNGATSWTFNWKAPATVTNDSIHFHFATLCANGNGQKTGDNALKSSKSVVLPSFVSSTEPSGLAAEVKISPNPTTDFLEVSFPGVGSVQIIDASGIEVLAVEEVISRSKLDVSKLKNGFYIVRIASQGKTTVRTFLKY